MSVKFRQILFYALVVLGLIKTAIILTTGSFFGIINYTSWIIWLGLILFIVFMWFFYKFAFVGIYSLKFIIIFFVSILVFISVVGFSTGAISFGSGNDLQTETNNSSAVQNNKSGLTENFIRCDVNGTKGVEFKMQPPSYATNHDNPYSNVDPILGETILSAFSSNGTDVMASFPGKAILKYTLTKQGEAAAYGLSYGIGTTGQSFYTDFENGNTFNINVTKYDGNIIEGTFSGEATDMKNKNTKVSLKNCVFKSNLSIRAQ